MKRLGNEAGFTLLEVMIAGVILAIGILTYAGLQISATKGNATSISITSKSNWAADQVEKLLSLSYNDLVLLDEDGDGTDQDPLGIGIDRDDNGDTIVDDDENFGLHHIGAAADGTAFSLDANQTYTIFWNIAVDKPLVNTVTVHVIVISKKQNAAQKSVEFDYIKAKII